MNKTLPTNIRQLTSESLRFSLSRRIPQTTVGSLPAGGGKGYVQLFPDSMFGGNATAVYYKKTRQTRPDLLTGKSRNE